LNDNIWVAYRVARKRRLQEYGERGSQELVSDHLQIVMDIVSLICACINGDLNVEELERKKKIAGEA
jgi:hypothetical protein